MVKDVITRTIGATLAVYSIYQATQETTAPVEYGIYHPSSLLMISCALAGVFLLTFSFVTIRDIFRTLTQSAAEIQRRFEKISSMLPKIIDEYYEDGPANAARVIEEFRLTYAFRIVKEQFTKFVSIDEVEGILSHRMSAFMKNLDRQRKALSTLATIAPSLGVLGTVLGLVKLLAKLEDYASLGPNMSLALLTTLYGLIFGSLILRPLANHIAQVQEAELLAYEKAVFFLEIIRDRKPSIYIAD